MPVTLTTQTIVSETLFCDPGTYSNIQFDNSHWNATSNIVFNGTSWALTGIATGSPNLVQGRMDYIGGGWTGTAMAIAVNKTGKFFVSLFSTASPQTSLFTMDFTGDPDGSDECCISEPIPGGASNVGYLLVQGNVGSKIRCIFGEFF